MNFWGQVISLDVRPTDPMNTDVSTVDTIGQMIRIAKSSSQNIYLHSVVNNLIATLPKQHSTRDLARSIWWWVKKNVKFVEDEEILARELGYAYDPNQELLIPPEVLMTMPEPQGDCDDFSMLVATLLMIASIPCWFVTIAVDGEQPWRFSHVFVVAYLPDEGMKMTMDVSHGAVPGWETQRQVYRRMEWLVS